jgi:hypothetical protein
MHEFANHSGYAAFSGIFATTKINRTFDISKINLAVAPPGSRKMAVAMILLTILLCEHHYRVCRAIILRLSHADGALASQTGIDVSGAHRALHIAAATFDICI